MKVIAFYADRNGNGWYRIMWPAAAVNATTDCEVEVLGSLPAKFSAHVAVFQRPLRGVVFDVMRRLHDAGCTIVVDMDDDMLHFPPGHPLYRILPRWHPTGECVTVLEQACELADLVTVPTPALAELYAPHGRYEIIPNCIPGDRLVAAQRYRQQRTTPTVGYRGAVDYHGTDLEEVGHGVQRAQNEAGFEFVGIGSLDITKRMHVKGQNVRWADLHDYSPIGYTAMLARIDIGLVPLRRCLFNEGKSDLAALEYAAHGIPTIASPTGPYLELERQGLCRTARIPAHWHDAIIEHLDRWRDRNDLIDWAASRTFELNAWRWTSAWEKAMANHG